MTHVLIKVYINNGNDKFLYWSAVLDTVLDSNQLDCNYLTTKAFSQISLKSIQNYEYYINFEFSIYNQTKINTEYANYVKRPQFFLNKDISPYKNCCCNLQNYYPNFNHQKSFLDFIEKEIKITDKIFFDVQNEIHNDIEKALGINIMRNESLPGCLSIYSSLPSFIINVEQRKIEISSDISKKYYVEVKICNDKCILYSQIYDFNPPQCIITLPNNTILEAWYDITISIFEKNAPLSNIVYQENEHCIRIVSFGMNTSGGASSLLKNRFSNKIETIPVQSHSSFSTSNNANPWLDLKDMYIQYFGLNKHTQLESIFFDFTIDGQNEFLEWMKNNFSGAEKIIIIDPFFDKNGLESLISCRITDVPVKLATLDPDISKREGEELTSKDLENNFYKYFSQGELYYCRKNELHDRYLVIESFGNTRFYNLSNSWNGAFRNNHSLLISQLSRENEKRFTDCYSDCFNKDKLVKKNLQNQPISTNSESEKKYTRKNAKKYLRKALFFNRLLTPASFVKIYREIYVHHAYGKMKKNFINHFFINSLNKRSSDYKKDTITIVIKELLTEQKKRFVQKNRFCSSTNEDCDDITFVNNICMHGIHEFYLELDWGYFYMLQALFYEYPEQVITSMYEESKNISKIYIKDGNGMKEEKYDLSRDIICLLLEKRYARINKRNEKTFIEFAKKTNSVLCKYYILKSYIESYNHEITIQSIENLLNIFQFSLDDRCMIYKNLYKQLTFKNNGFKLLKKNDIESYVSYNFINRNDLLIDFALNSYVFDKELDCAGISSFLKMNNSIKNDLFLLILLYSLSSCSDRKLFDFLVKNLRPKYYDLRKNITVSTLCNFHHYFTPLGQIFAEAVCDNNIPFEKIEFKFDVNYKTIFDTIASDKNDSFFILNIIFECLNELKNKGYDISKNVKNIAWYIPVLFNSSSYDMNSNDIKFAQLFSSLCLDQQKKDIHDKLYNERIRQWF